MYGQRERLIYFMASLAVILILLSIPSALVNRVGATDAPTDRSSISWDSSTRGASEPHESPNAPSAELQVCLVGCPYTNVQSAVDAANPGDVIKVASGAYTGVQQRAGVTQTVYLNKSVTIQGGYTITNWVTPNPDANPTTLDAQGQGRVFYITGYISPTIEGLRITGGNAAGLRGYVTNDVGGGVYIISATATISASHIFSNSAEYGGGVHLHHSPSQLAANTIYSNSTTPSEGGGLFLYESNMPILTGNTIISNSARTKGGGLSLYRGAATLSSNTIVSNTANDGGGLYAMSTHTTLNDNNISFNAATAALGSSGGGGGLQYFGGAITLSHNLVMSNTAKYDAGGLKLNNTQATLDSNMVISNTGGGPGGLALVNNSVAVLKENIVVANFANGNGGGLYLANSTVTLTSNTVLSNTTNDKGGGVCIDGGSATLQNNVIVWR
jgi:parallel beta-helix repeat protein